MRADAKAASHPACPAPITITPYVLVVVMNAYYKIIPGINAQEREMNIYCIAIVTIACHI
jgi:hypothetical protein